jgi:hypothetical protein
VVCVFKGENDLPIKGIESLVAGIDSAINNINTENARRTVKPNETFSPDSVGK